ncbi:MAG: hypothetical protein IH874_00930 [Candidatus Dadabacteria bacterium]|nr:hypothetical protein [Candidatus Dadabacteria bacterium]
MATIITPVLSWVRKGRRFVFLALSIFLVAETARVGLAAFLLRETDVGSMERSLVLNPKDAALNFRLARVYHMLMIGDEDKAKASYFNSLYHNPQLAPAWLGLAEMFIEDGDEQRAQAALNRAFDLAPSSIGNVWEGSILALRLGNTSLAIRGLRVIAKADPGRRGRVFDISWQLIDDPELILGKVVTDGILPSYLGYLISKDRLDATFPVWERMKKRGVVSDAAALHYVDFLIRKDRGLEAFSIWREMFRERDDDSIVWNGGFENEPLGRGFDWRMGKAKGVGIELDRRERFQGDRSLRITFDGKHNVDFYHVSQVIPIHPRSDYLFTSEIATRGITTRNGISWEVSCYPKGGMRKSSEPLTGTNEWKTVRLAFHTPSDCNSVVARLRRYRSTRLDRFISGTVWVDDVKLFKVETNANAQSR